jgi:phage shock protein A
MPEQRIKELELQLVTANETVATLTRQNAELTEKVSDAETRNKKLKRSARRDESSFKEQLTAAQNKRG